MRRTSKSLGRIPCEPSIASFSSPHQGIEVVTHKYWKFIHGDDGNHSAEMSARTELFINLRSGEYTNCRCVAIPLCDETIIALKELLDKAQATLTPSDISYDLTPRKIKRR